MSSHATWMIGLSTDDKGIDSVAMSLGGHECITMPPESARFVARQLLLCAEDADAANKSREKDEVEV